MKKKIRVLIVDDHAVVRRGLRSLFQIEQDIVVAGEAANGIEAVEAARRHRPPQASTETVTALSQSRSFLNLITDPVFASMS